MTKALARNKDVSGTAQPEETRAAEDAASQTHEATGHRPLWSRQLNRVDCSIWEQQHNGQKRYSVAISRSYLEKRSNQWKRSFYFDAKDLQDIRSICSEAEEQIMVLKDLERAVAED